MELVKQIQHSLENVNGFSNPHQAEDFVSFSEKNALLVKEDAGEAEVLICLQKNLLEKLQDLQLPNDFDFQHINDLCIVIEELSHFNKFCDAALRNQSISGLELEVQGEVDKFAVILHWLHKKNEEHLRERVFETLFGTLKTGSWVSPEEKVRYQEAHHIARNFCRRVLESKKPTLDTLEYFRDFFYLSKAEKLSSKF